MHGKVDNICSFSWFWETNLKRMKTTNIVFFQSIKSNSSRIVQDITAKIKLDLCVVVKSIV